MSAVGSGSGGGGGGCGRGGGGEGERKLVPILDFGYVVYEFRNSSPNTSRVWELCEFLGKPKKVVSSPSKAGGAASSSASTNAGDYFLQPLEESLSETKKEADEVTKSSSVALYFFKCHSPAPNSKPQDIPRDKKQMGDTPDLRVVYSIKLTHTRLSGLRKITVNGAVLHRSHKFFDNGSEHEFHVGAIPARLVIRPDSVGGRYRYELCLDGAQLLDLPTTPSFRSVSLAGGTSQDANYLQLCDSQ